MPAADDPRVAHGRGDLVLASAYGKDANSNTWGGRTVGQAYTQGIERAGLYLFRLRAAERNGVQRMHTALERRSLIRKTRRLPRDLWATRLGWPTSASHPHREADPWNLPPLLAPGGPAMEGLPSACARTGSSRRSHRRRWAMRLDVSPRTCGPGDRGTLANPGRGRSAPLCRGSARGSRRRRSHLPRHGIPGSPGFPKCRRRGVPRPR